MTVTVEVIGKLRLSQQLELLKMPLAKRKRLLRKVSNKVLRDSRKHIQTQTDLQGQSYKQRWKKRSDRRKMLSRLMKQAFVSSNDGTTAKIAFKGLAGMIAARQQQGFNQSVSAASLKKGGNKTAPATKRQSAELRALGYRTSTNKRRRPAAMKWIQGNMTIAQAGAIIRAMRAKQGIRPNTTWNTVLPARSFLGATDAEISEYIQDIFTTMTQEINHVAR